MVWQNCPIAVRQGNAADCTGRCTARNNPSVEPRGEDMLLPKQAETNALFLGRLWQDLRKQNAGLRSDRMGAGE